MAGRVHYDMAGDLGITTLVPFIATSVSSGLRRSSYRARSRVKLPIPVLSVGGLQLGGSGKTPVTCYLAGHLLARGLRVGVVCGAYRGALRDRPLRLDLSKLDPARAVTCFGDEAVLMARRLPRATVVCGRAKAEAAQLAWESGCEVLVVDDGFQHARLERSLDIVTVPDRDCSVRGRCLQWLGTDLIWAHYRSGSPGAAPFASHVVSANEAEEVIDGACERVASVGVLRGLRAFLVAAIARPTAFQRLVERLGVVVVGRRWLRDHHPLTRQVLLQAARTGADIVLSTEKDIVRMQGVFPTTALFGLRCRVKMLTGRMSLERRLEMLCGRKA